MDLKDLKEIQNNKNRINNYKKNPPVTAMDQ